MLYSELSGEEILQQWLDAHPEVVSRCEQQRKRVSKRVGDPRRKTRGSGRRSSGADVNKEEGGSTVESPTGTLQQTHNTQSYRTTPAETAHSNRDSVVTEVLLSHLEPFRAVLPPSLLPTSAKTAYPHTLVTEEDSATGWG